jgi:hypothetical protein
MAGAQESHQSSTREFSIGRHNGQVAIDIKGAAHERVLFTPAEARKLVAEIERAIGSGFGRNIETIRQGKTQS